MHTAFIGGVKSGKSRLAESYILQKVTQKPIYLATTECLDAEMQARVAQHQQRRGQQFETLEEPLALYKTLKQQQHPVLVECLTMWLNNMLYHGQTEAAILAELAASLQLSPDIVWVHNETGLGVIADNPLARQFVDLSGKAGQLLGKHCTEVYFCSAGLLLPLKF
jgi:adenosylcobinamide kinase/adenosylcobinamide-phosphate guanylyltransferase